jgi:hypothetical protein
MSQAEDEPQVEYEMGRLLSAWATLGFVEGSYAVHYDVEEGCWRADFIVANTVGGRRVYSKTEAEFGEYAMGIADALPDGVGRAARPLADLCRGES